MGSLVKLSSAVLSEKHVLCSTKRAQLVIEIWLLWLQVGLLVRLLLKLPLVHWIRVTVFHTVMIAFVS